MTERIYVGRKHKHIPHGTPVTVKSYSRPWYVNVEYEGGVYEVMVTNLRKKLAKSPIARKLTRELKRELEVLCYRPE